MQLDQILNTFDPTTRRAFQTWMQQAGVALTDRGQQFNAALAELYPFATNVTSVLSVLNRQGAATSTLLRDGGVVFSALSKSPTQVASFVRNSNSLFSATASRDAALAATIRAFPAFLTQTRSTINRISSFAQTTKPLVDELHPAAVQLSPALESLNTLAPELRTLVGTVGPLTRAAQTGFPALRRFLNSSVPFLTALKPYLGNVVPVINYIDLYRREIAGFFANSTASTQASSLSAYGTRLHYARISNPINPEALKTYQQRPQTNRSNAYMEPGGFAQLAKGLPVFGSYVCTANALPALSPSLSSSTTSVEGKVLTLGQLVQEYYYTSDPSGPACRAQALLGRTTTGQNVAFPTLTALP